MGTVEEEALKRRRLGHVQQAMLAVIALAGLLAVMMVTPNAFRLLDKLPGQKRRFRYYSNNVLAQLARGGYITFEERRGKRYARITEEGRRALALRGNKMAEQAGKKKRWDRRWRVVIFDIPEKRKTARDALRNMMRHFGFYRLQDSVWVYPYDCEDVVALVKAELKLGANVIYMVVERIENDQRLKEDFLLR